jgi:hypothetical protein
MSVLSEVGTRSISSSASDCVKLFDGKRIEDFLANDSVSDAVSNAAATAKLVFNTGRSSIPPFLSWAWLSSDFDKSAYSQYLADDNLSVIMQDIDRNLRRRDEVSYEHAYAASLDELDGNLRAIEGQCDIPSSSIEDSINNPSTATRPPVQDSNSPLRSLRHSIGDLLAEDIILREQKIAIHEALHDLVYKSKQFVGLFIPRSYSHVVVRKIWGALVLLIRVSAIEFSLSGRLLSNLVSCQSPFAKESAPSIFVIPWYFFLFCPVLQSPVRSC